MGDLQRDGDVGEAETGGNRMEPVGIIGGSGFYEFLEAAEETSLRTPYGDPSASFWVGAIGERQVVFLPRHGQEHEHPPHRINYRANIWGMRELGVRRIVAPIAAGSLKLQLKPGDFVVPDQVVDLTWGRGDTYYDGPETIHVEPTEPYCGDLRRTLLGVAEEAGIDVHDGGTVVVVQGPRFSTRAESQLFEKAGFALANMTCAPECFLARELELCYANLAVVTNCRAGLFDDAARAGSTAEGVGRVFAENIDRLKALLRSAIARVGPQPDDECATALTGATARPRRP